MQEDDAFAVELRRRLSIHAGAIAEVAHSLVEERGGFPLADWRLEFVPMPNGSMSLSQSSHDAIMATIRGTINMALDVMTDAFVDALYEPVPSLRVVPSA